jgi:hypothetical protein
MAKLISDNLKVKIVHKGEETVHDMKEIFNRNPNRVISIVGTVNEDGSPNTAPMSLFHAVDDKTIVAGMMRKCRTVENLKRDGRLIIEVLFEGDVSLGIFGTANVIKEPLSGSEAMLAVKIDVNGVKRDTSPAQIVISGPRSKPRTDKAVEFEKSMWQEIVDLGKGP